MTETKLIGLLLALGIPMFFILFGLIVSTLTEKRAARAVKKTQEQEFGKNFLVEENTLKSSRKIDL